MFATSFTTAAAFFANGFCELMPIASFGIWAGILIPMNYMLVIFALPPILVFWENKFKEKEHRMFEKCKCKCLQSKDKTEV